MSMLIGTYVHDKLSEAFDGRCYPVVAPQGAGRTPFAVYRILKVEPDYTKDGAMWDRVSVEVVTVGRSYDETASASQSVRLSLEGCAAECEDFDVEECTLTGYADDFDEAGDLYTGRALYEFVTITP